MVSSIGRFLLKKRQHFALLKCQNFLRHFSKSAPTNATPTTSPSSVPPKGILEQVDLDSLTKCQLEFNSGIGGLEAKLFLGELLLMYEKFAEYNGWHWDLMEIYKQSNKGGLLYIAAAVVKVEGESCYAKMRFEGGVHRVQRLPFTEKTGRVHSSTVSVAVLPEPETPEMMFSPGELKEEHVRAAGPGGANVNSKDSAVRLTYLPTGLSVKVAEERDLFQNQKRARQRLAAKLLKEKVDEAINRVSSDRKLQVGTLDRAQKIRTYSFQYNRVTDHRLKHSVPNVEQFMKGGEELEQMIDMMMERYEMESLELEQEQAKRDRERASGRT